MSERDSNTWISVASGTLLMIALAWLMLLRRLRHTPDTAVKPGFVVAPSELLENFTREEIETREMVNDPLQAVPDLPFGHLNGAWRQFLEKLPEDCELWSFTSSRETRLDEQEHRSGYVAVVDGAPGPYMLTVARSPALLERL
ncbi:MAG: hypothetical protein CME38_06450 [Haliea sp.]|nr:hypothetical protein [Haliea sp.]|tara:strand:- start:5382 stop:5810 length:429 start_codon:yes stop_codon:yes gene_type:complete